MHLKPTIPHVKAIICINTTKVSNNYLEFDNYLQLLGITCVNIIQVLNNYIGFGITEKIIWDYLCQYYQSNYT